MFYTKITSFCAKNGISLSKLCETIGLTNAAPTKWKRGAIPHYSTLFKLAQYFGVEPEFLTDDRYMDYDEWLLNVKGMTRAEVIRPTTWAEEKTTIADGLDEEFLAMAKQLNPGQLQRVKDFIRGMLS